MQLSFPIHPLNLQIKNMNEQYIYIASRTQTCMVELYRKAQTQRTLDDLMKERLCSKCMFIYSHALELIDAEESLTKLCLLKVIQSELNDLNGILLMGFQMGKLHSDICIDFGSNYEEIRMELRGSIETESSNLG